MVFCGILKLIMPAGRPELNYEELVSKAWRFVDGEWVTQTLPGGYKQLYPMVKTLAVYLGIHQDTLYARPEFSEVLKALREWQEVLLVNNGLAGVTNPLITKMALSAKHGYREQSEQVVQQTNVNVEGGELPADAAQSVVDEFVKRVKSSPDKAGTT